MRLFTWLALFMVMLCSPFVLRATHITGAELTYTCLNPVNNTYEVKVTVYRDCLNGQAQFDNNIRLFIFRGANGSLYNTINIPLNNNGIQIIPAEWNACTGQPLTICVEYAEYITTTTLPPLFGGYDLGWARCCRNNVVTNIFNNQGITVTGHVPGTETPATCNSMPTFNQIPPIFLCVGQTFNFDHSAVDIDGDSLVYSISNPYTGINNAGLGATQFNPVVNTGGPFANPMGPPPYQNINYQPGFSFTDPFNSGNFNMDAQSGLLTLTPTQVGLSVFAVSVKEYRNGVLLSENKRDFQINVVNCAPQGIEPSIDNDLTGVPGANGDTVYASPLEPFCYTVSISDPDPMDPVTLFPVSAAFGVGATAPPPYASLTVAGTNPAVGTVCWEVPCENAGDTIMLIVGGRDTTDCPGYNIVFDTTYVVIDTFERPVISHTLANGTSADTIVVDPLDPFCYTFDASDLDPLDTLEVIPLSGPFQALGGQGPYASLTWNGQNPISGNVCWTPSCASEGKTLAFIMMVQDSNYCNRRAFDTLYVEVNPLPPIDAASSVDTICRGDTLTLAASGGDSYSWAPGVTTGNPAADTTIAYPLFSVTYTVSITDSFNCVRDLTLPIVVNQLPTADAGPDTTRCPGVPVQLQGSGGVSYTWTPAATLSDANIANPLATPTVQQTYNLLVVDANGCEDEDQVTITPMAIQVGPDETICAGDSVSLTSGGGVTFSWSPIGSINNPSLQNPLVFPNITTVYTVVVTDSTGCVDSAQVTVNVNQLPPANAGVDTDVCIGSSVQLVATGGTQYQWSPAASLTNPNIANPFANPVVNQVYTVTVTDGNGCVNEDSLLVVVNSLPVVEAGNDTLKCGNTGVEITATGGVTYSWSPPLGLNNPNIANPIANPDSATVYTVIATDANGCQNTDSLLVDVMYADAGADVAICIGQSIQLEAAGGIAYNWDNVGSLSAGNVNNPVAFPTTTTTYTVTVTSPTGCTDTDQITVVVNPLPLADAGVNSPLCIGDTFQLNATGGVQYQWNADPTLSATNINNPQAFPTVTTEYFVTVTDVNGCVNIDSTTITVNALPVVDAGNDTAKCGDIGVPILATGGVNYQWSPALGLNNPNVANPIANPDSSTTYLVAVTDANGCTNVDSVFVRAMYADAGPDVPVCIGDTLTLTAGGGISYAWDASPTLINGTTPTPGVFPLVDTEYYVEVTDLTGCTDRDTVLVNVNPLPITTTGTTDPYVCSGGGTVLTATGGVQFAWSPANFFNDPTLPNPTAFPTYSGSGGLDSTWTFYVLVTDVNGCSSLDSVDQLVRLLPIITVSNDTTKCPEDSISLLATGGVGYNWSPPTGLSDPTIPNPWANPDTTTTYTATVTAVWGCADSNTVTINVVNPQAGIDATICAGDTTQLQAAGGVGYSWFPVTGLSNPNISDPQAFPLVTTDYIVTVTDAAGCTDVDTVTVFVNQLPPAFAGIDTAICIFDTFQLQASGGIGYQWLVTDSMDNPFVATPNVHPEQTTTYIVSVTDINLCVATDTMTLTVNPLPIADAGPDLTKCGEDPVQLTASGGVQYQWFPVLGLDDPLIGTPMANPDSNQVYIVEVTDANGCVNQDTMFLQTMYADAGTGDTICFGDTLQLFGGHIGGLGVQYAWTPAFSMVDSSVSNPLVLPQLTTAYVVAVTDSSGCVDTDTVEVTVLPPPPANAGLDTAICIGEQTTLQASGGLAYLWMPAASLSDPNIADPVATPVVTTTYAVLVTDANGCTAIDSVTVTVNPLPLADAGADRTQCGEDSIMLQASGGILYSWSPVAGLSDPNSSTPMVDVDSTQTYVVTVIDGNGCVQVDSMTVEAMYADAGPDQVKCPEDVVMLDARSIGGSPASFNWTPVTGLDNPLQASTAAFPEVTTTYIVEITDQSGCVDRDTVRVDVYLPPPADAGPDTAICFGESLRLEATGGILYTWRADPTLSTTTTANPVATPTVDTWYYVAVQDTNGCAATDSVFVRVNPLPLVDAGRDTSICFRDAALLRATGAIDYQWRPEGTLTDPLVADPVASPDITTTYSVIGTDANGCQNEDEVIVEVWQPPVAEGETYYEICLGQEVTMTVTGADDFLWSTGDIIPTIIEAPSFDTRYWAIPFGPRGCAGDTLFIDVRVERELPAAEFTPSTEEGPYPLEVEFFNESQNSTNYFWDFGDGNVSDELNPFHTYNEPGEFVVTLIADNDIGCPNTLEFSFINALDFEIFFPNAFSPNNDGNNDNFYIVMNSIQFFEINIFDRWGRIVYRSNNPDFKWDGTASGTPVQEGVYVYKVQATTFKGESIQRSGSITLVR